MVYAGYTNNECDILKSASGGVGYELSKQMIINGGLVAGVVYADNYRSVRYKLIDNVDDLEQTRGSKYVEVEANGIYEKVKGALLNNKQVLFTGLPCHVAALYAYLGTRLNNLITCELICNGLTYKEIHKEFLENLEKKYNSSISFYSSRYKKHKWTPVYIRAEFENGDFYEKPLYETDFGIALTVLGRESCYNCHFKGNNRQADIMIGDFWGVEKTDLYWNDKGVSVIFAETEKGKQYITSVKSIKIFESNFEKAVVSNPMVIESRKRDDRQEVFRMLYCEKGLEYAVKNYQLT